ncbi:hypothetical protein H2198_004899 [Neophaeococcomyces mojaviensis]|uniref:Uncharacterized protein n=1 Tax=Neophaeococcomyces mojaviensis TaxID=3383035 RepID=A0ACC3A7M8_9EURO|nr:hypothetical protein H2198_004899 [Knufia sp. JES_112]
MASKRSHDQFEKPSSNQVADTINIFESSSIEDRTSTFVAAFSPAIAAKILQAHQPYKNASHRILAWRKPSKQQSLSSVTGLNAATRTIYDTGSDDDGEKYAGKKLEKLLTELDVTGAVVVARWYGGVLLGPVRFDHILNVAKEAIRKWQTFANAGPLQKKLKVDATPNLTPKQEAEQKERLAKQLADRDNSIKILRGLLAEKKTSKAQDSPTSDSPKPSQDVQTKVVPGIDYTSMPLSKLKQLEKARDTTISWILKQIDETEVET